MRRRARVPERAKCAVAALERILARERPTLPTVGRGRGLGIAHGDWQAPRGAEPGLDVIERSQERLGWVLQEAGPEQADHTVLLLPGALANSAFYKDPPPSRASTRHGSASSRRRCRDSAVPRLPTT